MRRQLLQMIGLVFCTLCSAAAIARAQEAGPIVLTVGEVQGLPKVDAPPPADLLILKDAPRANEPPMDVKISPNTGMPQLDGAAEHKMYPMADLALKSSEFIDPRFVMNSQRPDDPGIWEVSRNHLFDQVHRLVADYRNFYLSENLVYVGVAVALAAPIANTHADVGMRNWYQGQVGNGQSRGLDETAKVFKQFGEHKYAIPVYLAFSMTGNIFPDSPLANTVAEFGDRSWRALAVGAPMVGVLQVGLGSDRPFANDSRWQPFRSNHGASGHAFVGAVPFLTAASMTDSYALKALLIAGSFGPAWSRIHNDDHYFSQAFLGWTIAALAVQSVNQTECQYRIVPFEVPNGVGLGVQIQY